MKWVAIFFVIIFLWQGYLFADYQSDIWVCIYSLWDKSKDFVLVWAIISLLRKRFESRRLIASYKVILFFLGCRIVWDAIVMFSGININNPFAIKWLFYISWWCIVYIFFYPTMRRILFKFGIWWGCFIMYLKRWWDYKFRHNH